ncbi:MAG TPA: hypothetical protein VIL38_03840, partial [Thermaerobacter sp.]
MLGYGVALAGWMGWWGSGPALPDLGRGLWTPAALAVLAAAVVAALAAGDLVGRPAAEDPRRLVLRWVLHGGALALALAAVAPWEFTALPVDHPVRRLAPGVYAAASVALAAWVLTHAASSARRPGDAPGAAASYTMLRTGIMLALTGKAEVPTPAQPVILSGLLWLLPSRGAPAQGRSLRGRGEAPAGRSSSDPGSGSRRPAPVVPFPGRRPVPAEPPVAAPYTVTEPAGPRGAVGKVSPPDEDRGDGVGRPHPPARYGRRRRGRRRDALRSALLGITAAALFGLVHTALLWLTGTWEAGPPLDTGPAWFHQLPPGPAGQGLLAVLASLAGYVVGSLTAAGSRWCLSAVPAFAASGETARPDEPAIPPAAEPASEPAAVAGLAGAGGRGAPEPWPGKGSLGTPVTPGSGRTPPAPDAPPVPGTTGQPPAAAAPAIPTTTATPPAGDPAGAGADPVAAPAATPAAALAATPATAEPPQVAGPGGPPAAAPLPAAAPQPAAASPAPAMPAGALREEPQPEPVQPAVPKQKESAPGSRHPAGTAQGESEPGPEPPVAPPAPVAAGPAWRAPSLPTGPGPEPAPPPPVPPAGQQAASAPVPLAVQQSDPAPAPDIPPSPFRALAAGAGGAALTAGTGGATLEAGAGGACGSGRPTPPPPEEATAPPATPFTPAGSAGSAPRAGGGTTPPPAARPGPSLGRVVTPSWAGWRTAPHRSPQPPGQRPAPAP